jgi:hypothetical protein
MSAPPFISQVPYEASHPHVLAVYCSDGRFTDAVEDPAIHFEPIQDT